MFSPSNGLRATNNFLGRSARAGLGVHDHPLAGGAGLFRLVLLAVDTEPVFV